MSPVPGSCFVLLCFWSIYRWLVQEIPVCRVVRKPVAYFSGFFVPKYVVLLLLLCCFVFFTSNPIKQVLLTQMKIARPKRWQRWGPGG